MAVTSLDIHRFSEIFHRQILWEICNNVIVKNPTTPYTSLLCLVKLNVSKTTDVVINDKSQGSVATRLRCVVKFLIIIILPIFVAELNSEKLFKSVNIWRLQTRTSIAHRRSWAESVSYSRDADDTDAYNH